MENVSCADTNRWWMPGVPGPCHRHFLNYMKGARDTFILHSPTIQPVLTMIKKLNLSLITLKIQNKVQGVRIWIQSRQTQTKLSVYQLCVVHRWTCAIDLTIGNISFHPNIKQCLMIKVLHSRTEGIAQWKGTCLTYERYCFSPSMTLKKNWKKKRNSTYNYFCYILKIID